MIETIPADKNSCRDFYNLEVGNFRTTTLFRMITNSVAAVSSICYIIYISYL